MMPFMASKHFPELDQIRAQIAASAARMIAEDGADYGTAKQKAAQQAFGNSRVPGNCMPDNSQIEEEVRLYNALFFADSQPARLAHLRTLSVEMMTELAMFNPYLTGAVLNGTAGEHADIHLHLFVDSPKEVEIFLLNKNIQFDISDGDNFNRPEKRRGRSDVEPQETLSFMYKQEGIHLALYDANDLRNTSIASGKRIERANLAAVLALLK